MSNIEKIHTDKTPVRRHFIPEWAERRQMRQADIVKEIGADKGLVSRWFKGVLPKDDYLEKLSALFEIEPESLFRHPDDDWLSKFFRDRTDAEREQAIQLLKLTFIDIKRGTGTDG